MPAPAVVRVWIAPLDRSVLPDGSPASTLAPDEVARGARFVFARDRVRYERSRALLRAALGGALGCPPEAVRFEYTPNGKPRLAGGESLAFNLSHSGDLVVIAIAAGDPALTLGVDIELARPIPDMEQVARSIYVEGELAALAAWPGDAERVAAFHRLWTRKEACMKATGAGFTLDPLEFSVEADAPVQQVLLPPHACAPGGATVTVHHLTEVAHDGCMGAVAVGDEHRTIEVLRLG